MSASLGLCGFTCGVSWGVFWVRCVWAVPCGVSQPTARPVPGLPGCLRCGQRAVRSPLRVGLQPGWEAAQLSRGCSCRRCVCSPAIPACCFPLFLIHHSVLSAALPVTIPPSLAHGRPSCVWRRWGAALPAWAAVPTSARPPPLGLCAVGLGGNSRLGASPLPLFLIDTVRGVCKVISLYSFFCFVGKWFSFLISLSVDVWCIKPSPRLRICVWRCFFGSGLFSSHDAGVGVVRM